MRKLIVPLLFTAALAGHTAAAPGTVRMLFFYSESCDHCQDVLRNVMPELMRKHPLEVRFYEVNNPGNYKALLTAEKLYEDHDNKDYPIIFFDAYSYSSVKEILNNDMAGAVARVAAGGGCPFPDVPPPADGSGTVTSAAAGGGAVLKPVNLAYFSETGCAKCGRTKQDLKALEEEFPQLRVREFNVDESRALNEALCRKYGVPERYRLTGPAVFIGDDFIHFEQVDYMYDAVKEKIEEYAATGAPPPWNIRIDETAVQGSVMGRFKSIGVLTIILAGLLDGINPCAFATIVFFISYLAVAGRKGREIIWVGSAFTFAIFITYLAVGLGFFQFIKSLGFMPLVSRIVYIVTIGLALVFGVLSFYDYFKYRKGKYEESVLKLPDFLRKRLNKVIRERARTRNFVIAAFVSGFLVSLLEFACTGQVYLPTVIFVSKLPGHQLRAVLLMVMYNLAFVLPLVVIFVLAYHGVTSQRLSDAWKRHAGAVKIGLGVFFLSLAALLYAYM